jgi:hypothetical protein
MVAGGWVSRIIAAEFLSWVLVDVPVLMGGVVTGCWLLYFFLGT